MAEMQKQVVMDPGGERVVMIFGFPVEPKRREVSVRPAEDVAWRALALHLLQGVIFHPAPEEVVKFEPAGERDFPDSGFRSLPGRNPVEATSPAIASFDVAYRRFACVVMEPRFG
jgi:hypothetical protein